MDDLLIDRTKRQLKGETFDVIFRTSESSSIWLTLIQGFPNYIFSVPSLQHDKEAGFAKLPNST